MQTKWDLVPALDWDDDDDDDVDDDAYKSWLMYTKQSWLKTQHVWPVANTFAFNRLLEPQTRFSSVKFSHFCVSMCELYIQKICIEHHRTIIVLVSKFGPRNSLTSIQRFIMDFPWIFHILWP